MLLQPLGSVAARGGKPGRAATDSPSAGLYLRVLLDTAALGALATYDRLGLQAGAVVQSFYARRSFEPAWTEHATGWTAPAQEAVQLVGRAREFGLSPAVYGYRQLATLPDSLATAPTADARSRQLATYELRLTDALLRYAAHLRTGQLDAQTLQPASLTGETAQQATVALEQALAAAALGPSLLQCQPAGVLYHQVQQAWSRQLAADTLHRAGNEADFRRVAVNLERLRLETSVADTGEVALVNIPAFRLQILKAGRVVQSHRVVVGKPETPTPTLTSRLIVFVTAPDWRVPYSIAVQEMLPQLRDDPGFLYDNHYRLYDYRNRLVNPWHVRWSKVTPEAFPYTVRQTAGRHNALGNIVFYFANQHAVFLHDTPARSLFQRPQRALSHGCVRVEKPLALATYLLRRENQQAALPSVHRSIAQREKCRFDLAQGLPLQIRYYTCQADNGRLQFYADVYCQDEPLLAALFGR
ncbi:L,D-transpeptidase family protein [Hymenobacter cellulosilyticus]|uniref:L,D-transpeptidase family protein n=1 Tax=Hymenobacter cellulosilyticus TaxID=2932248 RepID=A0A8T9Q965_9BACT|nr:L,D-transpeptidase family protein [Hymenobacter cellulosilyticus]UOQ74077.1 L,D-transpeptidase family protein [Hymenobacter cellulosilyticus]